MYTTKTFEELKDYLKKVYEPGVFPYSDYKLCYVDDIPNSYDTYDDVQKEWIEVPNPEYIEGKQEYYAYFTPIDLDEQWGDDWDDYPYEYNAETPYDSKYEEKDEKGNWKEYEIIKVPFHVDSWKVYFPKEWGCQGNSPFCVRDINAGAVAWVYYAGKDGKSGRGSVAIHAGANPFEFIEKIEKINND